MGLTDMYGFKPKPDLDYMTPAEVHQFKVMVEANKLSVFRIGACVCCRADMLAHKKYCCRRCKEMDTSWMGVLLGSTNKYVSLETGDGIIREGKITGFTMREFEFNGEKAVEPTEIELNGDPVDRVPLNRLIKINIS